MKKPIDPRRNGAKEPQLILSEKKAVFLYERDMADYGLYTLDQYNRAWAKTLDKMDPIHRLVAGPYINGASLEYTVEWFNPLYQEQKTEYEAKFRQYEREVCEFEAFIRQKNSKQAEDQEREIDRLKKRLANLEATRDGKELPYPNRY